MLNWAVGAKEEDIEKNVPVASMVLKNGFGY